MLDPSPIEFISSWDDLFRFSPLQPERVKAQFPNHFVQLHVFPDHKFAQSYEDVDCGIQQHLKILSFLLRSTGKDHCYYTFSELAWVRSTAVLVAKKMQLTSKLLLNEQQLLQIDQADSKISGIPVSEDDYLGAEIRLAVVTDTLGSAGKIYERKVRPTLGKADLLIDLNFTWFCHVHDENTDLVILDNELLTRVKQEFTQLVISLGHV